MKMAEYQQLFLSESQEILHRLNTVLVELEKSPADTALLNELFRGSHTLKGMAQSMGYDDIAHLTHSMESALALVRNGTINADSRTVGLVFESLDALTLLIETVRSGKAHGLDICELAERFEEMHESVHAGRRATEERPARSPASPAVPHTEAQAVRVPLEQLDGLVDLVGELAVGGIRLGEIAGTVGNKSLDDTVATLSRLTSQLQAQTRQLRLVPLEYILTPYPRLVRDIAAEQAKEVDLVIEGQDIGLDRSVQDQINEPLLHLMKNAVAHGIEVPAERDRAGKPRRGTIRLAVRREKDHVVLELSDDGAGIRLEDVRETLIRKGLRTEEELSTLNPEETLLLITSPGCSGAREVTEAAGRGVGTNAVRTKVESLGGSLLIDTNPGEGTMFTVRLPLTVSIIQALLVAVGEETHCIPLSYVIETVKIPHEEVHSVLGQRTISYRGAVLPLVELQSQFGAPRAQPGERMVPAVIVEAGTRKAAVEVGRLLGQREIVVKPLSGILRDIKGASGSTILSSGKVALIIDVPWLLQEESVHCG